MPHIFQSARHQGRSFLLYDESTTTYPKRALMEDNFPVPSDPTKATLN